MSLDLLDLIPLYIQQLQFYFISIEVFFFNQQNNTFIQHANASSTDKLENSSLLKERLQKPKTTPIINLEIIDIFLHLVCSLKGY